MSAGVEHQTAWVSTSERSGVGADSLRAATRIRRATATLLIVIGIAGLTLIYAWYEATKEQIAADLQDRLGRAMLEAALPTNHLLNGYESLLNALEGTPRASFSSEFGALTRAREKAFLGRLEPTYQLVILTLKGHRTAQWPSADMPLVEDPANLIDEARRSERPVLSAPYAAGGAWYATVVGRGPVEMVGRKEGDESSNVSPKFLALTFPLATLTEWWRDSGLPEGSSLAILTDDNRLWWRYPLLPDELGRDMTRDPLFGTGGTARRDFTLARAAPNLGGEKYLLGSRALESFGLQLVAAVPGGQIAQLWRKRHLASLMIFLAAGLVIVGSIGFGGWVIASEAEKRAQAMAALEASEVRFRDIADAASDWFWQSDAEGRFTAISRRMEDITGIPTSWLMGRRREDRFDDRIDKEQLKIYQDAIAKHAPFRDFVYPSLWQDGKVRWFRISGKPIFGADGAFLGYRGAGADITERREAEERLAALRARLERAIENQASSFALFDDEGRLAVRNQSFASHFQIHDDRPIEIGTRYEEIMEDYARSGRNLAAARNPEAWLELRRRIHESGRAVDEPLSDGSWIRTRESRTPEGELVCVYMDLTQDKRREAELIRLNEENRRLAAGVDAAGVGIVITNPQLPDNQVIFVNPEFTRITGYEADEVVGRNCRFLQGPQTDKKAAGRIAESLSNQQQIELEILNYRKDGSAFWNLLAINPVFGENGEPHYFVGIMNDVTAQKQSELELLLTKEAAEAANRSKSEFLAIMSHELRTPLNAIIGFSDILKAEMFGPVGDGRYKDYACDIFESGSHLLSLINDILDLSKAEAGKLELREGPFRIDEAVERALGMMRPHASQAGIDLDVDLAAGIEGLEIMADERKIKQVLLNLLSNAIKFSQGGTRVTVGVWRGDDGLTVEVADQGIGIAEEDIALAFEPFHQVDSTLSREREGTGLGLPLAKRMIELHDGTMAMESAPEVGTRVRFVLPLVRIQRAAA